MFIGNDTRGARISDICSQHIFLVNPQETPEAHAGGEQANQEKESEQMEKQDLKVRVMLALLDMFFYGSLSFPMFSLYQLSELSRWSQNRMLTYCMFQRWSPGVAEEYLPLNILTSFVLERPRHGWRFWRWGMQWRCGKLAFQNFNSVGLVPKIWRNIDLTD